MSAAQTPPTLERRAALARRLVQHELLGPEEALAVTVWPTVREAELLDAVESAWILLHGTRSGYKAGGCRCERCTEAKRLTDRVAA